MLTVCRVLQIDNLHPDVTEGVLYETFYFMGSVVCIKLCREKSTGLSKRRAFVTFWRISEAKRVKALFNNYELMGQKIRISFSFQAPIVEGKNNIMVEKLCPSITKQTLCDCFKLFGKIKSCLIIFNKGRPTGNGIISFETEEAATEVINKANAMHIFLNQMQIYVKPCPTKWDKEFQRVEIMNFTPRLTFPLYVRCHNLNELKIFNLFSKFGKVAKCEILENIDGSPTSLGFVSYYKDNEAGIALCYTNHGDIEGEKIIVGRPNREVYELMMKQNAEDMYKKETDIYICNLDENTDVAKLCKTFGKFGSIDSVIISNRMVKNKCEAYINFTNIKAARKALSIQGELIGTKPVFIRFAIKKKTASVN